MAREETIDAYDPALVRMAKLFDARSQGFTQEMRTAGDLNIGVQNWPAVALIPARGRYNDAVETMVGSAREGGKSSLALMRTLDKVRRHYSEADFASTPASVRGTAPEVPAPSSAETVNTNLFRLGLVTLGGQAAYTVAAEASRLGPLREALTDLRRITSGGPELHVAWRSRRDC